MGNKLCSCSSEEASKEEANLNLQIPNNPNNYNESPENEAKARAVPFIAFDNIEQDRSNKWNDPYLERYRHSSKQPVQKIKPNGDANLENRNRERGSIMSYKSSQSKISSSRKSSILNERQSNLLFESPLLKYKPSLVDQYLERWCHLTKNNFAYFVNRRGFAKPLISIPIDKIESVQRVFVDVSSNSPEKKQKNITTKDDCFQFEIFLKQDTNVSNIFKSYEHAHICANFPGRTFNLPHVNSYNQQGFIESRSALLKSPLSLNHQKSPKSEQKGYYLKSSKKNRFDIEDLSVDPSKTPVKKSKLKNWEPEAKMEELINVLDGIHFESAEEKEEYRNYKIANMAELTQIKMRQDISIKNPSSWISSLTSNKENYVYRQANMDA